MKERQNKNWLKEKLYQVDLFAKRCSIEYKSRQSHPSRIGGVTSIVYLAAIIWYLQWRVSLLYSNSRDNYISVSVQNELNERDPLYLKGSAFDFTLVVIAKDFDNEDSIYGEFKLHLFNTMDGELKDMIVPLKSNCDVAGVEGSPFYENVATYCPDFGEEHYLKNDYTYLKSSWMRLALHECDPTKRKKCATPKQANEYFRKHILNLQMKVTKPNLMNYETYPPLHTKYEDSYYSTREQTDLLYAREIFLKQSSMHLYDDTIGLFDDPQEVDLLEWKQSELVIIKNSESDPMNKGHSRYLQYWNFLLSKEQIHYERLRYTWLDIIGEIGGLISIFTPIIIFMLEPCLYMRHELKVFEEYQTTILDEDVSKEKVDVPYFFRAQLYMNKICDYIPCIRGKYGEANDLYKEIDQVVSQNFDLKQILKIQTCVDRLDKIEYKTSSFEKQEQELKNLYHKLGMLKRYGKSSKSLVVDNDAICSLSDSSQKTDNPSRQKATKASSAQKNSMPIIDSTKKLNAFDSIEELFDESSYLRDRIDGFKHRENEVEIFDLGKLDKPKIPKGQVQPRDFSSNIPQVNQQKRHQRPFQ